MEDAGPDTMATSIHRGKSAISILIIIIQLNLRGVKKRQSEKLPFHPP